MLGGVALWLGDLFDNFVQVAYWSPTTASTEFSRPFQFGYSFRQVAAAPTAVAIKKILVGVHVKGGAGFSVQGTESYELLRCTSAMRGPVVPLQILQQRKALF